MPIVQSSAHTKYFGQLMVTFNDEWKVISAEGNSHLLNRKYAKGNQYYKLIFVRGALHTTKRNTISHKRFHSQPHKKSR